MRILWFLSGVAIVLSIAAIIVSLIALIESMSDESDGDSVRLVDRGEFTVDMVLKAIEMYEEAGKEETLRHYKSPDSADGEWYVYVFDAQGNNLAHINPDVWPQNLNDDLGVDSTGYRFGDSILAATERGHWVDYIYENPVTGNQEYKHAWVVRHDGLIFGSGWYQVLPQLR